MDLSKIKVLVSEGMLEEAIRELQKKVDSNSIYYDDIVVISSRLNELNRKERLGTDLDGDLTIERNKISSATVSLISKVNSLKKGKRRRYLTISLSALFLMVVIFGVYQAFDDKKSIDISKKESPSPRVSNQTKSPKKIIFNTSNHKDVISLIFFSHKYNIRDTFEINKNETVKTLKETIRRNYNITLNTTENFHFVENYLISNNKKLLPEDKTLSELGVEDNDLIQFESKYTKIFLESKKFVIPIDPK